ncbi:helix-hairpin-helix domain-containing protein [Streptomyces sp. 7R007]
MALRSRPRTATVSSGPGRSPASDGRTRHRRSPARGRGRQRTASARELRRRAELLFPERPAEPLPQPPPDWRESEAGPPTAGALGEGAAGPADSEDEDVGWPAWQTRAGLALRERMPLWLQTRCGLERRNVLALTALLVVAAVFAVQHFWAGRSQTVPAPEVVRAAAPYGGRGERKEPGPGGGGSAQAVGAPGAVGTAGAEIVVDVSGKVRHPGIHRLPAGSRVVDALRAAGGVRPGTSTAGLNQARFLVDGEQVVVGAPAAPVPAPGPAAAGAASGTGPAAPVSLNTATVDQLDTLPGVGPVLARHIVDYRAQHGGFRSVDELREVNGIGDRRFADLRNLVRP